MKPKLVRMILTICFYDFFYWRRDILIMRYIGVFLQVKIINHFDKEGLNGFGIQN